MYLIGFIQTAQPLVLINPQMFRDVTGLYNWITSFLNSSDFELDTPVTMENLAASLDQPVPVQIHFNGYAVATLQNIFGEHILFRYLVGVSYYPLSYCNRQ